MGAPKQQVVRDLDAAVKRQKTIQIVREGGKLDDVVSAGLYASRGAASKAIKDAMMQARAEMFTEAELYRTQQLDRLESLLGYIWPRCKHGDDKAIAEARRIISDIGDLTGAKAPVRFEIGEGDVDRLLARLDALLTGGAGEAPGEIVEGEILDDAGGAEEDGGLPRALPGPG
jgi:hypothetical protein